MTNLLRRDALLRFKVETDLARAVETTARHRGQTMSEFVRQSVRAHLARHGVRLSPDDGPRTPPAAPALRQAA
ncbi:ribbon-helix-helix protein, CopG family [Methylobacterium pseudosasicola]|uniref:Ribbon-helix-helix protein, copG family n=1 Tax=Methylobacterium pseudosasicola TaxID=582667 RepID=A0A1I4N2L1_9HYPH|nr:ribbon-helix-helix protein, CopG family [Methylobacterium pseudosasicola]SFM09814.1 Ribbon-helix-helix protein, copG family [Methylobacterium pseudosasicola]